MNTGISLVYIAAPFFKPAQMELVRRIEDFLDECGIQFFSPRTSGTLIDMTEEERVVAKTAIYDLNIEKIIESDLMIAVIDDFDTGTVFEMGYASALDKRIISISDQGHGLNVMLAESVQAHVTDFTKLEKAIYVRSYSGVEISGLT